MLYRCFPGTFNLMEEEENTRPTKRQANLYNKIVGTALLSTYVNAALQSQSQKRKWAEDEEEILVFKRASNNIDPVLLGARISRDASGLLTSRVLMWLTTER